MGKYLTGWPSASPVPAQGTGVGNSTSLSPGPQIPPEATAGGTAPVATANGHANGVLSASSLGVRHGATRGGVPAPSLPYDLHAVVNHSGSMAQGHYTAFVKEVGRWFRFDDTWVREVDEEEVLRSEAYLLFYVQRGADTRWKRPQHEVVVGERSGERYSERSAAAAAAAEVAATNVNGALWPPAIASTFPVPAQPSKKKR